MISQQVRKAFRTMFIGLGGTGNEVIRRVKQEMLRHGYDLPIYQYLVLDTVAFNEDPGMNAFMQLRNGEEYLYIGNYNPNEILKNIDKWPVIDRWWGNRWGQNNLVTVDEGAGQMRSVGRMGFFRHFNMIQGRLDRMVHEVMSSSNREMALLQNFYVPNDKAPIIYLVFSLCGGTGSSLFFDVAYVLRKFFGEIKPIIVGLAMLPGPFVQNIQSIPQRERIQANTYAALQELERLHDMGLGIEPRPNGRDIWDVQYATNFRVFSADLPFDYIYLIDDTTTRGEKYRLEHIYELMSQSMFWLSAPTTATRFWERAKNLNSNTLAAGGYPDASGRLRLSKYSSLGIGVATLNWRFERVQYELEARVLRQIQAMTAGKSALPNWLNEARTLVSRLEDEPGVNSIPKELKPNGPFQDRAYVDQVLEGFTTKYEAALASFSHSMKWSRCRERYKRDAINELDTLFQKSLVERGPLVALHEMGALKEALETAQKGLDSLEGEAAQEETKLRESYETNRRRLQPVGGFVQFMGTLRAGVGKLYGLKNAATERELEILAESFAHERYLWYSKRFKISLCREAKKYILEPALAHVEKLRASLEGIDDALDGWRDRLLQDAAAPQAAKQAITFEAVIKIQPRQSEKKQIDEAIKHGDLKIDVLVSKILAQAFNTWPKAGGGNAVADLQDAMNSLVLSALQRIGEHEHLLDQLLEKEPDAWKKRELFLQRADCLWSFDKNASQQVLPHLETIDMLGYGMHDDDTLQNRDVSITLAQLDELLKQLEKRPEQVPTDINSELAYIKTLHGLPISLIRSMEEWHHAYQVMNTVRSAPYLHLDYQDQVQAGYGPLANIEKSSKQIVDLWKQMVNDIGRSKSELAEPIRKQIAEYEHQRLGKLHETVQVSSANDPLFDLIDTIEKTIRSENKTPAVSATLTELSDLIGLLHAQGWVLINPAYGAQFDRTLHEKRESREDSSLPDGRIIETLRHGYIRRVAGQPPQVRKALVVVSENSNNVAVSRVNTVAIDPSRKAQKDSTSNP